MCQAAPNRIALLLVIIGTVVSNTAQAFDKDTISFCNDNSDWPPFLFKQRVNGVATDKLVGYDIDVINYIFTKNKLKYTYALIPWNPLPARCGRGY